MILLKKPYTPVVFTSATKSFNVYGKSFFSVRNVYLSGFPYTNTTFYNPFSGVPRLSAAYPGFNAVKLLSSQYSSNNDNTITFTMPSAVRAGYVDIIVENEAGYGALTKYVIKELYGTTLTQQELRPWAFGIRVQEIPLPQNLIYTHSLSSALQTFNGNGIITFDSTPAIEIFTINNEFLVSIDGKSIITIQ
jgi:hypothetical protein